MLRPVARRSGTPPVSSEARIVRRMSTAAPRRRPRCSWPSVARRRFSWATARWTAARSWVGLVGSARSSSASGREGGSFSVRSISARSSSRRRWRSKRLICSRSSGGRSPSAPRRCACSPRVRRIRCTSTPITPEPSPRRPKAAIASRARSRISPSRPSAIACADRLAKLVQVEALAALVAALLADPRARAPPTRRRGRSSARRAARRPGGPPATWRPSPPAPRGSRPRSVQGTVVEGRERVEDLRGPDRDALAAQLLAEGDESRRSRAGRLDRPPSGPGRPRTPSAPPGSVRALARQLDPDPLGHQVHVGAVLDDDAHRALEQRRGRCPRRRAAAGRAPSRSTRRSRAASSGRAGGPCG